MEGASWTNNLSWVQGYDNVLEPMNQLSARFHQRFDQQVTADPSVTGTPAYQEALLHLLLLETSCLPLLGPGHLDRLRPHDSPTRRSVAERFLTTVRL